MAQLFSLGIVKRLLTISTLLSAIGFCFLVIVWPVSYHLNLLRGISSGKLMPSDSIPIAPAFRLGFQDGGVWFYNEEMPYMGGISWMSDTNDPPPVMHSWYFGHYGFGHSIYQGKAGRLSDRSCDLPGIYFRQFWAFDDNPPYTTLCVSLWYPISLLAVLPVFWFYRRGHFWFRKP